MFSKIYELLLLMFMRKQLLLLLHLSIIFILDQRNKKQIKHNKTHMKKKN